MRFLFILLLIFLNSKVIFCGNNQPFVLIIIDVVDDKFVYITSDDPDSATNGYDIQLPVFKTRMNAICKGIDQKPSSEDWIAEMWIDKIKPNKTIIKRLQAVYQCVKTVPKKTEILPKLLRKYSNKFERHLPKRWAELKGFNPFNCTDVYGRTIPMPIGVRRCFVQQSRVYVVDSSNKVIPTVTAEYGTDRKPIIPAFEGYECEENLNWLPFARAGKNDKFVGDGECLLHISLMEMKFFCCCYTNSTQCDVANVRSEGLTCPVVTVNSNLIVQQGLMEATEANQKIYRVPTSALDLRDDCYVTMTVEKEATDPTLQFSLAITSSKETMCKEMFKKRTPDNPCHYFERPCVMDTDDKLIYCCHFLATDVPNSKIEDQLAIHKAVNTYMFNEYEKSLYRISNCLRPYGDYVKINDESCIFYFDQEMDAFINLQEDENIFLTPEVKTALHVFLNSTVQPGELKGAQFNGRYNVSDPKTFGCVRKRTDWQQFSNKRLVPMWYEFTFTVFKCKGKPGDEYRCDDFENPINRETILQRIKPFLAPQYQCNDEIVTGLSATKNGVIKHSYDAFCIEYVDLDNDGMSYCTPITRKNILSPNHVWLSNEDQTDHTNTEFFCGITKDGKRRFCACTANTQKPCNTGHYVKTFNEIAKQDKFIKMNNYTTDDGDDKRVCQLPQVGNTADVCLQILEEGTKMNCFFLLYDKRSHADIGCLREPGLTQRRLQRRIKSPLGWHDYQICNTVTIPEDKGYKCILKDKTFDNYADPVIVCCCHSETCKGAYTEFLKRSHWKETHNFV